MKILGGAGISTYIVEMSRYEIAQIAGDGHRIGNRSGSELDLLKPGVELEIGEKWKRLCDLDRKAKGAAGSIPESLRMMAGLIEMAGTSLLPVEVPDSEFPEVEK